MGRTWLGSLANAFLIRDPAAVVASYARVREEPTLEDLGFPQQVEIFRACADRSGFAPPVVDAADLLAAPEPLLRTLCGRLGLDFDPAMLRWPAGARDTDGVWAAHWYSSVAASTSFAAPGAPGAPGDAAILPDRLRGLLERCRPYYEELLPYRLLA
jgi:hypothetical protein